MSKLFTPPSTIYYHRLNFFSFSSDSNEQGDFKSLSITNIDTLVLLIRGDLITNFIDRGVVQFILSPY